MRSLGKLMVLTLAAMGGGGMGQATSAGRPAVDLDMQDLKWKYRPLLLFAPSRENPDYVAMRERIDAAWHEIVVRNMIVIEVVKDGESLIALEPISVEAANRLRNGYGVGPDGFTAILVGKDGGEKLRVTEAVPLSRFFELIDTMPMRRQEMKEGELLIDDFSNPVWSRVGTEWRTVTDQVMGGVSEANHTSEREGSTAFIRLQGDVSLENNGGFAQIALQLHPRGGTFDASEYTGVRLRVRGNGETYYVHLRSAQSQRPWQYHIAQFAAGREWRTIELPFKEFEGRNLESKIDTSKLRRLAISAAKKAYRADLSVARVEFYR